MPREQVVAFEDRHREYRSDRLNIFRPVRELRISQDIGDMYGSAFESGARSSAVPAGTNWMLRYPFLELRGRVKSHYHPQKLAVETEDKRPIRPAQSHRTLGHCLKDCLKIKR